ncbi:MAG TPA: TolC family protein [Bacteroidia bacterium]|jgi:cobalt-zinc-cadmium efflux system outer membrane protein|nr:TolC family protein [Bacteroidia bacterium]
MRSVRQDVRRRLLNNRHLCLLFGLLLGTHLQAQIAQDTLHITLPQAEKMFLDSNLLLLAQKYTISAQKALILQARLYPNPNLSFSRGPIIPINDPSSQYPHSDFLTNSENAASLSQLILLAGKRNKQIKLAEANVNLAEYQFFDLLRTLKYTLRTDFFNIYYLQQSAKVYQAEIDALQQVADAFEAQKGKGYVAEKEVVRIKAQLYSFQSEYNDLKNQIYNAQEELRLVLKAKSKYYLLPQADTAALNHLDPLAKPLQTLLDSAYKNRTDLLLAKENTEINKLNYKYQKALAVPDLTVFLAWDHQGSYAKDFNSAGVAMDLPVFNRNQGNIKMAKIMIDNTQALQQSAEAQVEDDVSNALRKAFAQNKLSKNTDTRFLNDFDRLMKEVMKSYMTRQISILDFLDFYDSYKQNVLQSNAIYYGKVQAFEDLNFSTATNFFN